MNDYDSTEDVMEHKRKVSYWIESFISELSGRSRLHDASKLMSPEKAMFDEFIPKLKELEFGSAEYKQSLKDMGNALEHHYYMNSHHPEHYEDGIVGMTLLDLVEMLADWMAAAQAKNTTVNLDYLSERFGISDQLKSIFLNTLQEEDFWGDVQHSPIRYLSPVDFRKRKHIKWILEYPSENDEEIVD